MIIVGAKNLAAGIVEIKDRYSGEKKEIASGEIVSYLTSR
jgi:histidyl-tRNA synthetase